MPLKETWVDGETYTSAAVNAVAALVNVHDTAITGKQPSDSDLTAIAAIAPANDDIIQRKAGAWVNRTAAQYKVDLGVAADIAAAQLTTVNPQTGTTYTLALTDAGKAVECNNAAAISLTVPPNSTVPFPIGSVVEILQVGAGAVTIVAGAGVTVNTPSSLVSHGQWSTLGLRKRNTDIWVLSGDMN